MGHGNQPKPHNRRSLIDGQATIKIADIDHNKPLVISFKYYDPRQGQAFDHWEKDQILAKALETLHGYCQRPSVDQCKSDKFTVYGAFPKKSEFRHPEHVPPDAQWTRIHVNGKQCVIGHVFKNIFYLVFLDKEHRFWPTDLQDR
jgi:hypothetical protein